MRGLNTVFKNLPKIAGVRWFLPPSSAVYYFTRNPEGTLSKRRRRVGESEENLGVGRSRGEGGGKHVTTRERVSANLPVPRNPAPATDSAPSLVIHSATSAHLPPQDFLCFPRPSFPLRQSSLSIFCKIITSGRWGLYQRTPAREAAKQCLG